MMGFSANVFVLIFVFIAAVSFVGFIAYVTGHSSAVDVTISNTTTAYYGAQSQVNQSINQSLSYATAVTNIDSPMPLFAAILVLFGGLCAFLVVVKRR
jgi:hypothetical protein